MRYSINQAKLTLEIESFLKRLKRQRTKWDGFYSQLTNLLLDGEFKHEVRQFQKPYDNQQAEQISLMV